MFCHLFISRVNRPHDFDVLVCFSKPLCPVPLLQRTYLLKMNDWIEVTAFHLHKFLKISCLCMRIEFLIWGPFYIVLNHLTSRFKLIRSFSPACNAVPSEHIGANRALGVSWRWASACETSIISVSCWFRRRIRTVGFHTATCLLLFLNTMLNWVDLLKRPTHDKFFSWLWEPKYKWSFNYISSNTAQ